MVWFVPNTRRNAACVQVVVHAIGYLVCCFFSQMAVENTSRAAIVALINRESAVIHGFSGGVFSVIEIDQFTCSLASGQITLITLMPCKFDCVDFIGVINPGWIAETTNKR